MEGKVCQYCGRKFRPWRVQDGSAECELYMHESGCKENPANKEVDDELDGGDGDE